jgi:hypothetical protein
MESAEKKEVGGKRGVLVDPLVRQVSKVSTVCPQVSTPQNCQKSLREPEPEVGTV